MCFSDGLLISFCDCLLIFLWLLLWLPVNIFVLLSVLTRNRAFECSYQKSGFRAFVTAWAFVLLWLPVDWAFVTAWAFVMVRWLAFVLLWLLVDIAIVSGVRFLLRDLLWLLVAWEIEFGVEVSCLPSSRAQKSVASPKQHFLPLERFVYRLLLLLRVWGNRGHSCLAASALEGAKIAISLNHRPGQEEARRN